MKTIKVKDYNEMPDNYTGMAEHTNGTKAWYKNGQHHRLDGPAIVHISGTKIWFKNGQHHRLDGPAVEHANGYKAWCKNGQRHRLNGPAIECESGRKAWYINGKEYTEEDWLKATEFYRSASGKYYL